MRDLNIDLINLYADKKIINIRLDTFEGFPKIGGCLNESFKGISKMKVLINLRFNHNMILNYS